MLGPFLRELNLMTQVGLFSSADNPNTP
jgi:hypothetical protein